MFQLDLRIFFFFEFCGSNRESPRSWGIHVVNPTRGPKVRYSKDRDVAYRTAKDAVLVFWTGRRRVGRISRFFLKRRDGGSKKQSITLKHTCCWSCCFFLGYSSQLLKCACGQVISCIDGSWLFNGKVNVTGHVDSQMTSQGSGWSLQRFFRFQNSQQQHGLKSCVGPWSHQFSNMWALHLPSVFLQHVKRVQGCKIDFFLNTCNWEIHWYVLRLFLWVVQDHQDVK